MSFIKDHILSIFCATFIIWCINVFLTQMKYKKKGIPLIGTVVDYVVQSSNYFPVFEFEYEGQKMKVDSYQADKANNGTGTTDTIYYLPGNTKGVFRERDLKPKLWMIAGIVLSLAVIIIDFGFRK